MSTGFDIRPVQSSSVAPARIELGPERQIARTELPDTQVVVSAAETQSTGPDLNDQSRTRAALNVKIDALQPTPQKKVILDDDTKELVFRTVSAESGQVVSQFPDEAYLRQRAYAERLEKTEQRERAEAQEASGSDHVEKVA